MKLAKTLLLSLRGSKLLDHQRYSSFRRLAANFRLYGPISTTRFDNSDLVIEHQHQKQAHASGMPFHYPITNLLK